jgi:4-hydroxy-3-methylbut-2-enyl diphosphate reductase (EC 1.17.1.2)
MIHNPEVNADIKSRGVEFIFEPDGRQVIEWNELSKDDIIMIPAFGITIETETKLKNIGIEILKYNTTCPFVEKVWNRAYSLGTNGFSVVVHGKYKHEETKATYSHSKMNAPTIIVFNLEEAKIIGRYILGEISKEYFFEFFKNKLSDGFDPDRDLQKLGVVNQTTMLATETQAISDYLYDIMEEKYGSDSLAKHFADTRDTLCYATHDNQNATYALLAENADLAIVVGGYNSSNTSHIVDLCEQKVPTYFISSEDKIISRDKIKHYDLKQGREIVTENYIPAGKKPKIILTSGASCPDSIIEAVMKKAASFFENAKSEEEILSSLKMKYQNPDTDKN